jgi:hypothetical protein
MMDEYQLNKASRYTRTRPSVAVVLQETVAIRSQAIERTSHFASTPPPPVTETGNLLHATATLPGTRAAE